MRQESSPAGLDDKHRKRVAPALRELRERRSWTIEQAAHESGIRPSILERYERGRTIPSKMALNRLATAFGVGLDYFLAFDHTSQQLNTELIELLDQIGIPRDTWAEFSQLSITARTALIHTLRRLCWPDVSRRQHIQKIENLILARGIQGAAPDLINAIQRFGLTPMDFIRAQVQLEELPGERLILTDRLPMAPTPAVMDQMHLFRATFGFDPSEPLLLKWWANARRTAIDANLQQFESRTIIPMRNLMRYIRTGERAAGVFLSLDAVRNHIVQINRLIRSNKRFRIGILESSTTINFRVKGPDFALVGSTDDARGLRTGEAGTGLRIGRPEVVALFRDQFNETWDAIPTEMKDSEATADLLDALLQYAGQPSR